jgi:hypothetical protein
MTGQSTMAPHSLTYESTTPASGDSMGTRGDIAVRLRRRRERREYWLIFGICFAFFIVVAVLSRMRPSTWRRLARSTSSIWMEAKEEARLCTAAAFQG